MRQTRKKRSNNGMQLTAFRPPLSFNVAGVEIYDFQGTECCRFDVA